MTAATSPELLAAVDAELRRHSDSAAARAQVLLDVVVRCYDTVQLMADANLVTTEQVSLGQLFGAAYSHAEAMQVAEPPQQRALQRQPSTEQTTQSPRH